MRQVTKKGLITVAAAGGVLALGGGYAQADSGAEGTASHSPGVLSGNSVQIPVHVPVNACGNTVNVIGALNPAMGNACANKSGSATPGKPGPAGPGGGSHTGGGNQTGGGSHTGGGHTGGGHTGGGSSADGTTANSPGIGSGNNIQVPIDIPVNACGNGVSVVGLLNPAMGNDCANESPATPATPDEPPHPGNPGTPGEPHHPVTPPQPHTPPTRAIPNTPRTQTVTEPKATESLAQTGASGALGTVIPAGAGLLLAGAVLYRRSRSAA
ncbi:chaplin [Streptomyces sp. NPDC004111]|uniref:chaplin n=1 Tax=Streptomyces sp. NPDC004111 TaxID=3364690 RepID=UPI00367FF20E